MSALRLRARDVAPGLGEALGEALSDLLAQARPPRVGSASRLSPRLTSASVPIAPLDPIAFYAAAAEAGQDVTLLTRPDDGLAFVGVGRAWGVGPGGPDRFQVAQEAWQELLATASIAAPADRGAGPVLLGSLGFSGREPATADAWSPFGPSSLVLPDLTVAATPGGWWLTGNLLADDLAPHRRGDPAADLERAFDQLAERARAIGEASGTSYRPATASLRIVAEQPDAASWERIVGLFAGAVGRGRLDKVVLARRLDVVAPVEIDVPAALRRLTQGAPESTVFAVRRGERAFLGATPERLVRKDGLRFWSAAVAGTVGRGADAASDQALAARVLASEKDREEHEVVVAALREQLAPLAGELRIAGSPRVLSLPHVQHLVTDLEGTLREPMGLLGLAERLHPTPAVGGEPRDLALAMIEEYEGFDRGWYAGPIGWVGADGDGELSVALRCGIVDGDRATLFAGCGIVADSDPGAEWAESTIKLRAVASALGRPAEGL